MIDLAEVQSAFPQLRDIVPLRGVSGQKEVLRASLRGKGVCLKIVKPYKGGDARTQREIHAVTRLTSTFVPAIYDHGAVSLRGEVRQYIIEEFIEGETHRQILNQRPVQPLCSVLDLINALLLACCDFEAAHLVHRDIKPENLLIDANGKVWVLDFGLARHLDLTSVTLTGQHFGVGTVGYAPPEQYRNLKPEISSRTDLYSIGMVAYESLAGRHPFLSLGLDHLGVIRKMDSTDVPVLHIRGDGRGELSAFLSNLLQRFPSRRPQNAAEAIAWFRPIHASLRCR